MASRCCDLDGVSRFSDRADAYVLGRPSYPAAAIDFVLGSIVDRSLIVLDVGAGPGIGTRLLASGARAIGVDPGIAMLRAAGIEPPLPLVAGLAEELPVRTASVGVVTVFNAFHWFRPNAFFEEAHRVIEPSGNLALVWNKWDDGDEFTSAFVALMRSCAGDYPHEDLEAEVAPLFETTLFRNVRRREFANVHELDREHLRLRLQSMSYVPMSGSVWDEVVVKLDSLFDRYADGARVVRHHYVTNVFVAKRAD